MSSHDTPMANADAGEASELLIWPWTGVIAMTTADGEATSTTLASHAQRHFAGVTTTMLREEAANHHCHFLLLHFGKSWAGLREAMSLAFQFAGAGRSQWQRRQRGDGDEDSASAAGRGVFGWAAGEEDLLGGGAVGRFLRESGATARSVEDVQKGEAAHADALDAARGEYERRETFLDAKNKEKARLAQKLEEEINWLHGELQEFKVVTDSILPEMNRDVEEENEKLRAELDAVRTKLHCSKVEKLVMEINSLEMVDREAKARDHAQMLRGKHKEEMEGINARVVQLEKQLEQKEAQESAIHQLNMKLQTGENLSKEECQHLYKLMTIWKEALEQERERYQNAYIDITKRYMFNRDVLQQTRQELIEYAQCSESMMIGRNPIIGIKRMGQLDERPFHHACKRKYRDDDPEGKAARLVSIWQEELKNTFWNPFTAVLVDGEEKDIVDEDDPKLRQLWTEYGDKTCDAVKNALRELNEYSPKGRQAVNELWNFTEGRKATMAEVVKSILEQLKTRNQSPVHKQVITL